MSSSAGRPAVAKYLLRALALIYLLFLLVIPVGLIAWRTFGDGLGPVVEALTSDEALHAIKRLLNALIDLPLAVSPVIAGLALILVYGKFAPVGGWLEQRGIQVIFSIPGMVLATIFVSLPLVVRAVAPVLEELGVEQEQAAQTLGATGWQTFRRITIPGIRWALAYGVVLCMARALGEYGALAVVSGRIVGETQTLTLFVEDRFQNFYQPAAFAAATLLALIAIVTLLLTKLLRPKGND